MALWILSFCIIAIETWGSFPVRNWHGRLRILQARRNWNISIGGGQRALPKESLRWQGAEG